MTAHPPVAARLREGQLKKSPIREIMKLADRRNIDDVFTRHLFGVLSFGESDDKEE